MNNASPSIKSFFEPASRRSLVVVESPYRGNGETREEIEADVERNLTYARLCLRDCISRGESPFASHLLYTQPHVLDDTKPKERALGIALGLLWLPVANYGVFYTDRGWSYGMLCALIDVYRGIGFDFRIRSLEGKSGIRLPKSVPDSVNAILIQNHCED